MRGRDGQDVLFVARPDCAPLSASSTYFHPDDLADTGVSWRTELLKYNEAPGNNPLGLLPAWQLYANKTYPLLAHTDRVSQLYILSAGWGLIAADFLTPAYDITFSPGADPYKRRRKKNNFHDLNMLPANTDETIVFFGGKSYVGLFCNLTVRVKGPKHIFYNSANPPQAQGCVLRKFPTKTMTNWHYGCAHAFVDGEIEL